ncbi:BTB/POZ domain-containing protein KCTD7-like [Mercenaria mercenaria]|uniref:BTB/POZ domain-containing protein KCTD7-like n=1 Tax=Mercenaria mercenaria TaxID=6596 RepID=UPI00234E4AE3|nr:BTB/POZ domain-containing protein KCTD7-like [Mercenaria mercenaria]
MNDSDSSDSSVEEIDIKAVRPAPRSRPRQNAVSPARSLSPNSVLNVSGDTASIKRCIDNYSSINSSVSQFPSVVPLNVGGIKYVTRLSTLKKYPDSMLSALFSGRYQVDKDADGNFFLDSNGILFGYLLEFLRNGLLPPREQSIPLYREASYYGLHELVEKLTYMPPVVSLCVKEAHKSQFPNYEEIKENVIKVAMENATFTKIGEVIIYAFKSEFVAKVNTFNPNHGCIVESAHIKCGPWDAPVDEAVFIKCLENDLIDDGFNVKPHDVKKKCRYYHGQSCQKYVYRLAILM